MSEHIVIERTSEDGTQVRRWTFRRRFTDMAINLTLEVYEEGSKPTPRHRNLTLSKRSAFGTHRHGFGATQERRTAWWDALLCHSWSPIIGDLRGSAGYAEAPELPDDVKAEAARAIKVTVGMPTV